MQRNTVISICKALAIILMVIGHADAPEAIHLFLYEFHMPVFFITAGFFFSLRYLTDEATHCATSPTRLPLSRNVSRVSMCLSSNGQYSF